jgi:DNA-binding NarL/FixJ family response regulator
MTTVRQAGREELPARCAQTRVVLALSHARLRDAIAAALSASAFVSVVGCAGDLAGAIELTRVARADGVLVGAGLLQGDIARDLRGLVAALGDVRIVVIGSETSAAYGAAMAAAGAADYVTFDGGPDSVVSAVRRAIPDERRPEAEALR